MVDSTTEQSKREFSLVKGGPAYKFYNWARLSDGELRHTNRRVLAAIAFTWLPLLILQIIDGSAFGSGVKVSFLRDIDVHTRLLVVLPVLIAAESHIHRRIANAIERFLERNIVTEKDVPRFNAAIDRAHRVRNSPFLEIGLVVLVYVVCLWFWLSQVASETSTWYAHPDAAAINLTSAGYWFVFVSLPILQFVTLRWYARFFIWFWFLRQLSKLDLNLRPAHPDRCGGIGFLGRSSYAFAPILFAQGAALSVFIASEVIYNGRELMSFRGNAAAFLVFFVAAVLSPLCVFVPDLLMAKRRGLATYGLLAGKYVDGFEKKWIKGENPEGENLLGTGDIQSLADLGNSYGVIREMRLAPFSYKDVLQLVKFAALPLVPLALLKFSPEEILTGLFKILF